MQMLLNNNIQTPDILRSLPFPTDSDASSQSAKGNRSFFNNLLERLTASTKQSGNKLLALANLEINNQVNFESLHKLNSIDECLSYQDVAQLINLLTANNGLLPGINSQLLTIEDSNNFGSIPAADNNTAITNAFAPQKFTNNITISFLNNQDISPNVPLTTIQSSFAENSTSIPGEIIQSPLATVNQVSFDQDLSNVAKNNVKPFNAASTESVQPQNNDFSETDTINMVLNLAKQQQDHSRITMSNKIKLPDGQPLLPPEQNDLSQYTANIPVSSDSNENQDDLRITPETNNSFSNFSEFENDTPSSSDFTNADIEPSLFAEPNRHILAERNFTLDSSSIDNTRPDYNLHEQIIDKVRLLTTSGNSEIVIKLKPEHLGELTLKVAIENGQVNATFHTNNQEVRSIIETSLPQLRQDLQNNGLKVSYVNVESGLSQFQPNDQHSNARPDLFKLNHKKNISQFEEVNVVETIQLSKKITAGVDYRV